LRGGPVPPPPFPPCFKPHSTCRPPPITYGETTTTDRGAPPPPPGAPPPAGGPPPTGGVYRCAPKPTALAAAGTKLGVGGRGLRGKSLEGGSAGKRDQGLDKQPARTLSAAPQTGSNHARPGSPPAMSRSASVGGMRAPAARSSSGTRLATACTSWGLWGSSQCGMGHVARKPPTLGNRDEDKQGPQQGNAIHHGTCTAQHAQQSDHPPLRPPAACPRARGWTETSSPPAPGLQAGYQRWMKQVPQLHVQSGRSVPGCDFFRRCKYCPATSGAQEQPTGGPPSYCLSNCCFFECKARA